MKNKQPTENCTLSIPLTNGFLDPDLVEQVVKETFIKEPRIKQERK